MKIPYEGIINMNVASPLITRGFCCFRYVENVNLPGLEQGAFDTEEIKKLRQIAQSKERVEVSSSKRLSEAHMYVRT